jgi:hypothetical protein
MEYTDKFYSDNHIITPVKDCVRQETITLVLDSKCKDISYSSDNSKFRIKLEDPIENIACITLVAYYVPTPWFLNTKNNTFTYSKSPVYFNPVHLKLSFDDIQTCMLPVLEDKNDTDILNSITATCDILSSFTNNNSLQLISDTLSFSLIEGHALDILGFANNSTSAKSFVIKTHHPILLTNTLDKIDANLFSSGDDVVVTVQASLVDDKGIEIQTIKLPPNNNTIVSVQDKTIVLQSNINADSLFNVSPTQNVMWGICISNGKLFGKYPIKSNRTTYAYLDMSNCNRVLGPTQKNFGFARINTGLPVLLTDHITKKFFPRLKKLLYIDIKIKDIFGNPLALNNDDCFIELQVITEK